MLTLGCAEVWMFSVSVHRYQNSLMFTGLKMKAERRVFMSHRMMAQRSFHPVGVLFKGSLGRNLRQYMCRQRCIRYRWLGTPMRTCT